MKIERTTGDARCHDCTTQSRFRVVWRSASPSTLLCAACALGLGRGLFIELRAAISDLEEQP